MATSYTIEFNADAALQTLRQFPERTTRAAMRSLNRSLTTGRATLARLIAADMGIKVSDAKEAIKVRQATPSTLEIRLAASLQRLPLIDFKARQTGRGVSANTGGGRKTNPHAFIATMTSGHVGVFARTRYTRGAPVWGLRDNPKRERIDQLHGASIGRVFAKHQAAAIAAMEEAFAKNLPHELRFAQTEAPRA